MTVAYFDPVERDLIWRLQGGVGAGEPRRIHVTGDARRAALRRLAARGYAKLIADDAGVMAAEPTALGASVRPQVAFGKRGADGTEASA